LAQRKRGRKNEDDDEDLSIPMDPDIMAYRQFRELSKKKKIKTNLDLMETFNQTALKFVPIFEKKVNQQEMIERYNKYLFKKQNLEIDPQKVILQQYIDSTRYLD
jgi:hypothetical protein